MSQRLVTFCDHCGHESPHMERFQYISGQEKDPVTCRTEDTHENVDLCPVGVFILAKKLLKDVDDSRKAYLLKGMVIKP